ncbi:hypothetical protein QS257_21260 [Terrilactibacillus sp. S3-3]|nr:hypothetical protein QS257_21260 [Terrilactibacillus sp. S3-3]
METTKKGLDEEARKIVNHEYTIIKEDCAFCKGTGRLEAEACSLCQGTGKKCRLFHLMMTTPSK